MSIASPSNADTVHLPAHGRISCVACFRSKAEWGHSSMEADGWILENNPMAWGARDPRFLVLGFSKGARQCADLQTAPHDDVLYRGFRGKLTEVLRALGLLAINDTVDAHIRADEPDWAYGSVVRCSIAKVDPLTGRAMKSGDIIGASARRQGGEDWIGSCMANFLGRLPQRLRIVVLLSNDDDYVDACFNRVRALHPSTRRVNGVAYGDDQVLWVHVVHVGGPGANHISNWLAGAPGTQGDKRRQAIKAVEVALGGQGVLLSAMTPRPAPAEAPATASIDTPRAREPGSDRDVRRPNPFRAVVADALFGHPLLEPHPAAPQGTKKVQMYLAANGRALGHLKEPTGEQPIFVQANGFDVRSAPGIRWKFYPASANPNSNLNTAPEFKGTAKLKLYPKTQQDVVSIVEALLRIGSSSEHKA